MKASRPIIKVIAVVLLAGVLPLLASLAARFVLGDAPRELESLHVAVELVGSCIALSVAMLLLLRLRYDNTSPHLLWVAAALIAMGLVDGLHGVHGISLHSWQRHGATFLGGILFALVWLPLPSAVLRRKGLFCFVVAGLAMALGLWWGAAWMPATWDPVGLYTFPVKAANGLGGLGFLVAALFFCRRYLRQSHPEDLVFASLTVLFGIASLLFGLAHTWAADWWVWHTARLLAYIIVLAAAYETIVTLYRQIGERAQELEVRVQERTVELRQANEALLAENEERQRVMVEMERRGEEQTRLNAELKRANRATLNLMQDAVQAKDWLEQANRKLQLEITERRRAEEAVRETNEYLDNLFNCANAPIIIWDPQFKITRFNHAFESLTGRRADEVIGKSLERLFPLALVESSMELIAKTQTGERWETVEIDIQHIDGSVRTVLWNSATLFAPDGKTPVATIAQGQDITERKRVEESLREAKENLELRVTARTAELAKSNQLLAATGRLARVGGWELDLRTNKLSWTDVVHLIHEVGPEYQPTVENGIHFYAPEAVPVISEVVRKAIADGQSYDIVLPMITAKGNRIWVRTMGQAVRDGGQIVGLSGVFQDITEHKQAEARILNLNQDLTRRTADLEAVNHELEAFSYSVSHDLKAPLRSVDGFAQMLEEDYAARLDDEGRRLLRVVRDSARDMGQLINDLLTFSRLSRKDLKLSQLNLRHLVEEARRQVGNTESGRTIRWDIGELPSAFGDEATIREVLINLFANAVKFTRPRQEAVIGIAGREEGDDIVYTVTDNGVGFDMAYKDKLFCVFQRLHSTDEFEGTGIGLALVQRIIQRHGGRVWADSALNCGATFSFTLPGKNKETRNLAFNAKETEIRR